MLLSITNDGPLVAGTIREGYGILNLRSRLQALYVSRAAFSLKEHATGGAIAGLDLPLSEVVSQL